MPWKSKAQASWGHSPAGIKALGGRGSVSEWDAATPKGSLPNKVRHPVAKKQNKPISASSKKLVDALMG
jgi:hypothetical protein